MSRASGLLFAALLGLAIFVADQFLKRLVRGKMVLNESRPVIQDVLHLTYIENSGGAFGILADSQLLLMVGSAVALGVVAWMLLVQPPSKTMASGGGLVLGGAAGNLLDRLTSGGVTDYLDFRIWPIFNLADIAIVIGVGMLILNALFHGDND